jgi:hypothetical protein
MRVHHPIEFLGVRNSLSRVFFHKTVVTRLMEMSLMKLKLNRLDHKLKIDKNVHNIRPRNQRAL